MLHTDEHSFIQLKRSSKDGSTMTESNEVFQQQVVDARRRQILDAAERVFGRRGYHRATIREVAREAGIADGTIYNYFANKEDLMRNLLSRLQQAEGRAQGHSAGAGNDLRRFMPAYLRRQLAFMMANRDLFRALLPELLVDADLQQLYLQQVLLPSLDVTTMMIEAGRPSGAHQPIDSALASRAVAAAILGLMALELLGEPTVHERWGELPEALSSLFLTGLTP